MGLLISTASRITFRLQDWLRSETTRQGLLGACCGLLAIALLAQIEAALGIAWAVRLGLGLGTLIGIAWGLHRARTSPEESPARLIFWQAALLLCWPVWLAVQLDLLTFLPLSAWSTPWTADLCGLLCGVLSSAIPAAVITQWLLRFTADTSPRDLAARWLPAFIGFAAGMTLLVYMVAPAWGALWPAWCGLIVSSLLSLPRATIRSIPRSSFDWPSLDEDTGPARVPAFWQICLVASLAGWFFQGAWSLYAELVPASIPGWTSWGIVLLAGWCLGVAGSTWQQRRSSPSFGLIWIVGLVVAGLVPCCLSPTLIHLALTLSSRVTSPAWLELSRLALLFILAGPTAVWLGWTMASCRQTSIPQSFSALTTTGFAFGGGLLLAETCIVVFPDPVNRLWIAACLGGGIGVVTNITQAASSREVRGTLATGFATCALLIAGLLTSGWPVERATKLLFSTPALLAIRSDWPISMLPQLDETRMVTSVAGREGRWTLWKSRGADLHVRSQGIPRGSMTVQPGWSPQSAPEIASTVWPLVLVDQPARVLVLGAGSSASLQAAMAFPISELVCCEADTALMKLLQQQVVQQGAFDPFADDRCRHLCLPENWLTLPRSERFDVIVSSPGLAILPSAQSALTCEYYRRAAERLTPMGVFCQRVSLVDFGPQPLLTAAMSLKSAFQEVACLEVGPGEYLLLGAHQPAALVRDDLPQRLELPHVAEILSRCNWDWSLPLNLPAYDGRALAECAQDCRAVAQTAANPWLGFSTPRELLRWGPKLIETANLLTKPRATAAVYPLLAEGEIPRGAPQKVSRKSRYLEWVGHEVESAEILRRLSESATQQQLIHRYPDSYWWEYRKELREQLQDHPRSAIRTVGFSAGQSSQKWHPEDRRRKAYFENLGAALSADRPTPEQLSHVERLLEPYDPLLTLFAHQELADLYFRAQTDPLRESDHRLHVIYFAPSSDASVRNVVTAIDHLVKSPEAAPSDVDRFDRLNGLLQVLRSRWEVRNSRPAKSARVTLQEIERSLMSVERAIDAMPPLALAAGLTEHEWALRKQVLERILVRPFRGYRDQLAMHAKESERKTREFLSRATAPEAQPDSPAESATGEAASTPAGQPASSSNVSPAGTPPGRLPE